MTDPRSLNGSPLLVLASLALSFASPAAAQYYYGPDYGYAPRGYGYGYGYPAEEYAPARRPRPISARAVIDRLEHMGYEDVGRPRFTGTLYIVEATGPGGVRQQIVVDAVLGSVLNRTVVEPGAGYARPEPRRYGGRPLDDDGLYRNPAEAAPRPAPRRRETGRPAPAEPAPSREANSEPQPLPPPADPRLLAPSPEPAPQARPRPLEGRPEGRQATRGNPAADAPPRDAAPRPLGINPSPPAPKPSEGEQHKAAKPAPEKKKPVAEARPMTDKPVRVIQGVTPLSNGESRPANDGAGDSNAE